MFRTCISSSRRGLCRRPADMSPRDAVGLDDIREILPARGRDRLQRVADQTGDPVETYLFLEEELNGDLVRCVQDRRRGSAACERLVCEAPALDIGQVGV